MKYRTLRALPAVAFVLSCALCVHVLHDFVPTAADAVGQPYILIDPGHGGEDGGAVGCGGVQEKSINLRIGNNLKALLTVLGFPVRITRTQDISLATEGDSIRARKVSDMHNRLTMYNAARFTVSIHQNYFEQSQYSGAQLFCADNIQSKALGECIRAQLVSVLQPDNRRANKTASGDIFLLHEAQAPAVIVECGFLTNPAECVSLMSDTYQKQMAAVIAAGIAEYAAKEQ